MLLPAGRRPATDATFTIRPASRAKMTRGGPRQQKRSAEVDLVDVVPESGGWGPAVSERDADVPPRRFGGGLAAANPSRARAADPRGPVRRPRGGPAPRHSPPRAFRR